MGGAANYGNGAVFQLLRISNVLLQDPFVRKTSEYYINKYDLEHFQEIQVTIYVLLVMKSICNLNVLLFYPNLFDK